jgi:hypothetical protein
MKFEESIAACQRFYENGAHIEALAHANAAIRLNQANPNGWLWLAVILHAIGEGSKALIAMSVVAKNQISLPQGIAPDLYELFLRGAGEHNPRIAEIFKPCPIFGPLQRELSPVTEQIIATTLSTKADAWRSGKTAKPRLAVHAPEMAKPYMPLKLLVIDSEFIDGTENNIRNDITDVFMQSAALNHFDVRRSQSSESVMITLQSRTLSEFEAGLKRLEQEIRDFGPDLVLLDANAMDKRGNTPNLPPFIQPEFFKGRHGLGYAFAVVFPDLYDPEFNYFEFWAEESDFLVIFNDRSTQPIRSQYYDKRLYWPSLPFDARMFKTDCEKTIELSIVASLSRGRDLFANYMNLLHFPGNFLVHDRSKASALSSADYADTLTRSKMIFNNGTLTSLNRIVTARALEAIWSKGLLLEESGSDMEHLFVPFVHYVPFANMAQFVAYCQFFQKHPKERESIVEAAYGWATENFAASKFWAHVRHRLYSRPGNKYIKSGQFNA